MKIGLDSRSATLHAGSGIGTYTKNLALNLINHINTEIDFIWTGNYDCLSPTPENVKIFLTSGKNNKFFETSYIPNLINEEKIDLYHIPQNGIGYPFNSESNVIVTIHDIIPYIMPETVGRGYLDRFLKDMPHIISKAKGIITVSEYSKKDILRFFPCCPENKIIVTPLAANGSYIPISKELCKNIIKKSFKIEDPFILYLGGFSSRKNVKNLILSYKNIRNSLNSPCKLVLGGALLDQGLQLKEFVNSIGLYNEVIFTGYIEESFLPYFYNSCEVFVYPSLYEGFGLPPLEAMSCKCPVISSNITSIPEITQDSALLINPNDIDDLSLAIKKVINNDSLKQELAQKGYKQSLKYSWEKTTNLTVNAYSSVLSMTEIK